MTTLELLERLERVEEKLDAIIGLMTEPEEDDDASFDLDGNLNGRARAEGESLG